MKKLVIEPTKENMAVLCSMGEISLSGSSILADPKKFFQPIEDWICEYVKNPSPHTEITLKFEYIDTASVQSVFNMLKYFKDWGKEELHTVMVNWHFEFDDPELLELGEILQGRLNIPFNFVEYNELTN